MKPLKHLHLYIQRDVSWLTLSNLLSALRIALAPCFAYALYHANIPAAFLIFIIAGISDLFDGLLARLRKEQTNLGRVIDPIADKVFMITAFASIAYYGIAHIIIPHWFIWFVVIREITMMLGSALFFRLNKQFTISPSIWGKATTASQMIFIVFLFLSYFSHYHQPPFYDHILYALVALSFCSFLHYAYQAQHYLCNRT